MERMEFSKIGHTLQIAGTRHYKLAGGAGDGVRAIDVKTGGGLEYTVLPDRGLDISLASFRGVNLTYLSLQGEIHPAFYSCEREEWLRTFFGGLLTTCGPASFGPPCEDGGTVLGLHGRHNVTPAVYVCDDTDLEKGEIRISGRIEQSVMFGEKLSIKRTIRSAVMENVVRIRDEIKNCGGSPTPYTLLYHINFGYPLLDTCAQSFVNSTDVSGCDEYSAADIANLQVFSEPDAHNREKNYTHTFERISKGCAGIYNEKLGCGVSIRFPVDKLPFLTQWKMEGVRDYVLALEPGNAPCESRKKLREKGNLPFLRAGESTVNEIEIEIITKQEREENGNTYDKKQGKPDGTNRA